MIHQRIDPDPVCHAEHSVTPAAIRQAIETIYPGIGAWVCDEFESHSQKYFDGRLELRPILFGLTPHGKNMGHYRPDVRHIMLHSSLLKPKGRAWMVAPLLGRAFCSDVLLHEMVHASVYELLNRPHEDCHNNPDWCAEIVRITPMLGLPPIKAVPIRQKRIDKRVCWYTPPGHLDRKSFSTWPYSIRSKNYYKENR